MKILTATFTDFIKFNKKPNEDYFLVSSKYPIFVIGDGVTQSLFEDGKYAYPAGARVASQIFCHSVLEYIEKNFEPKKEIIEKAFDFANERIWQLNLVEGMVEKLDYDIYDLFDTVGVTAFLINSQLFYGFVGDCGLAIFDKNNFLKFETKDLVLPAKERAKRKYPNWEKIPKRERTKIMHKEFRNCPSGLGYGSFTGEKGVKKYYRIDKKILKEKDLVVLFSDGFREYLKFPEFVEILRKGDKKSLEEFSFKKAKENPKIFGTDRTLISFVYEKNT